MRINGFSGIDVDTMVKEMMKPYNIKVDREKQQRDLVSWKQDLYRDVTKNMKGLYNKYFDVLSKDYLLSPSKLSSTKAESKDSSIVDVSGLSGAKTGTYNVKIDKLAKSAQVTSDIDIKNDGLKTNLDLSDDTELTFNVNGSPKKVTIKKDSTVGDMIDTINKNLKDSGVKASYSEFSGNITIENARTGSNSSLEIDGLDSIKVNGSNLFASGGTESNHGELNLVKDFVVDENTSLKSLSGNEIKIPAELGKDDKEQIITIEDGDTVSTLMDKIKNSVKDPSKVEFEDGKIQFDGKEVLNANNVINEKLSLGHLAGETLTIGGKPITIDANDTIRTFADKIKAEAGKDVIISGGVVKFATGTESNINFSKNDMLTRSSYNERKGTDAEFSITLPDGTECTGLTSETNIFTKDNLTFTFNNTGETTFTVKNDVSGSVDKITGFIDDYNKLVGDMYSKVTTKKNKMGEYLPLSAEQKKEMSEDEIKTWEAKGKNGLLKGDMLLNSVLGDMRGVFDSYTGMGKELNRIGIGLSGDTTKPNCIEIDKDKLTKALENDGEDVINMLISKEKEPSKKPNGDPIVDKDGKPVMISKGVFARLKDTTYDACMKYKSKLSEKAGIDGSTGDELSKAIAKRNEKIKEMEKDLKVREQAFYVKFSRLEQAMSKLNSQQSALSQQFGGM